jgi:hypothetical protein
MTKTYLINYDYGNCVFVRAKSDVDAVIYLAEYCNGKNDIFRRATQSMENLYQLIELYNSFYSERIDIILEVDETNGYYNKYVQWIGEKL